MELKNFSEWLYTYTSCSLVFKSGYFTPKVAHIYYLFGCIQIIDQLKTRVVSSFSVSSQTFSSYCCLQHSFFPKQKRLKENSINLLTAYTLKIIERIKRGQQKLMQQLSVNTRIVDSV